MKKYALTLVVIVALLAVKVAFAQLITGAGSGGSGGGGGGGGVTSLSGTANQIDASAATGAVTLSLSSTAVAPGTLAVTTRTGTPASYATFNSSGVMVSGGPFTNPATSIQACGRLTGTASTPVTNSDVTSATTLFYVPYICNSIALWDGSQWVPVTFTDTSLALSGLTNGKPYDVFAFLNGTSLNLETLIWTNDTTRGTAVVFTDGRLTKSGDKTRLLIGTFYVVNGGNTTVDTAASRFISNAYNTVARPVVSVTETADTYTYASTSIRQANANTSNQLNFLVSFQGYIHSEVHVQYSGGTNVGGTFGIGLDVTNAYTTRLMNCNPTTTGFNIPCTTSLDLSSGITGRHFLSWNEAAFSGATITSAGDAGTSQQFAGIWGFIVN